MLPETAKGETEMQYTSAEANKLLRQLQEEYGMRVRQEQQSNTFVAATVEDPENARPAYDYAAVQAELRALEEKIRRVKHAISAFNLSHTVEGFDMTVDQMLVYIPQLSERKARLGRMAAVPEKRRLGSTGANIIEYEYANFDPETVRADYIAAGEELSRAQLALDKLNTTETMEIDL